MAAAADDLSLGFAHLNLGNLDNLHRAREYFRRADDLAARQHATYLVTAARVNEGKAEYDLGNTKAGTRLFRQLIDGAQTKVPAATDGAQSLQYQWLAAAIGSGDCQLAGEVLGQVQSNLPDELLALPRSVIEQQCKG
jgi:hypothetical protein